jgi:hypothetical protein
MSSNKPLPKILPEPPPAPKKQKHTLNNILGLNNVKTCLFRIPIKKPTTTPTLWISKCPHDMLDEWELFQ